MSNLVSWSFYCLRKKINPKEWVSSRNIKTYEEFADALANLGIKKPSLESVQDLFPPVAIVPEKQEEQLKKSFIPNKKGKFRE